jgi:hypothetical protein
VAIVRFLLKSCGCQNQGDCLAPKQTIDKVLVRQTNVAGWRGRQSEHPKNQGGTTALSMDDTAIGVVHRVAVVLNYPFFCGEGAMAMVPRHIP